MNAEELSQKVLEKLKEFKVQALLPALKDCSQGAIEDVLNTNGSAYYQFSTCLVDLLKPAQVIELGGAMGVWCLCVLHSLPTDSKLYSITLPEHGLEFSFIKDNYPNLIKVLGDDLDLKNWLANLYLSHTDLWFFDSLHTKEHLEKELELYKQFFRKGTILLFDDIRMEELWPVWESLPYDKAELTNPCHYSGYGLCIV